MFKQLINILSKCMKKSQQRMETIWKKNSRTEKYNNWSEKLTDGLIRNWIQQNTESINLRQINKMIQFGKEKGKVEENLKYKDLMNNINCIIYIYLEFQNKTVRVV